MWAGVVLLAYRGWRIDNNPLCYEATERYCQYLAQHRYGKGAKAILAALKAMPIEQGEQWVRGTFAKYCGDVIGAVGYMLNRPIVSG